MVNGGGGIADRCAARFDGRTVLVTGAASGLGEACARCFAAEGARLVLVDVDAGLGQAVADSLAAGGSEALFVRTDVTRLEEVEAAVRHAVQTFGGLDAAVNSAGMGGPRQPLLDLPVQQWHDTLALNLTGVFYSLRAELRVMVEQRQGAIVNMASIFGTVGGPTVAAYTAAKHGVIGLTRAAALEYGPSNVRINAVAPTFVRTPLTAAIDEQGWSQLATLHPLGRFPTPEDVAGAVAWLASDEAAMVTGSVQFVDAGFTAG